MDLGTAKFVEMLKFWTIFNSVDSTTCRVSVSSDNLWIKVQWMTPQSIENIESCVALKEGDTY